MFSPEIILLGFALAIDAAVVSFALGLHMVSESKAVKFRRGASIALVFGLFQFGMTWLGSYGGFVLSFSSLGHLFPVIVMAIFIFIGLKLIYESFKKEQQKLTWGVGSLLVLGIVTSLDALASGLSIGILPKTYLMAIDIGMITVFLCSLFFCFSQFFKRIPENWLLRFAGLIFLGLGGNVFLSQFMKGNI